MPDPNHSIPSVLAVVVVKDGVPWLRRTLSSLARQTHPRLGVLAIDNGSRDGSSEVLREVLGPRRCIRLRRGGGFAAAVGRALEVPAAREADFLLLLHDDVALAPDAVERLVESAGSIPGAGVVGPKVLDWKRRGVLLDIGSAADRFGYPYSPLEDGEIDQGQYDAVREVLFVSSAAMLVSREASNRAGPPDDRLSTGQPDLDYCWRVRLAGLRVLVDPSAVALHRRASETGERDGSAPEAARYLEERGGLVALLKNYRLLTLLWILPLYAVQAVGRFLFYLATGHARRALEVARAWGWNVAHLPSTLRRRFRAQRARRVRDHQIAMFMAPAGARLQRWAQQASSLMVARPPAHVEDEEEPEAPPLHRRVASIAVAYPVAVGLLVALLGTLIAFREVLFVPRIEGGSLPVFPEGPLTFFREFAAGWRSTGFGGTGGASPATVVLGLGSGLALGQPMLLARLLVTLTPLLAGIVCYRAAVATGAEKGPAVVAGACYALSALGLWVASEGSLPGIAVLLAVPVVATRLGAAFRRGGPRRPLRWLVGTGAVVAVAGSFFPAIWLAGSLLLLPLLVAPEPGGSRVRGGGLSAAAALASAILVFPFTLELARVDGGSTVGAAGVPDFGALVLLSPGSSPGAWIVAAFLPVAGVLAFAFAEDRRGWAWRSLVTAAAGIPLAWLAAAGHLPDPLANPLAFLTPAAFSLSLIVALGLTSMGPQVRRASFGGLQLVAVVLVAVLAVGVGGQIARALGGGWAVGEHRVPPAWPVVASARAGQHYRVLWLGPAGRGRFQPPGGEAQGAIPSDPEILYGVTGPAGRSALAVGLPAHGAVYDRLEEVLRAMLSGRVSHGGALLAPFGIRFAVAEQGDLPPGAVERLDAQIDLNLVQAAGGMRIYRNAVAFPEAGAIAGPEALAAARSPDLLAPVTVDPEAVTPFRRDDGPSWRGAAPGSEASPVLVATSFHPEWTLEGGGAPFPAFGWAVGFEAPPEAGELRVAFGGQATRTMQLVGLSVLWLAAIWFLVVRERGRRTASETGRTAAAETAAEERATVGSRSGGAG